jgi:cell division ATPase FtsA
MIRSVKLTGGGAKMPGICDIFRMQLTKETSIVKAEVEGMSSDEFLRYSAAIGLASEIIRKNNEVQTDNTLNFPDEQVDAEPESDTAPETKDEPKRTKEKKGGFGKLLDKWSTNMFGSEGDDMQE